MGKRFSVRKPLTLFFSKTEHRLGQRGRMAFPGIIAGSGKHHFLRRVRGGPPSPHGDGGPSFHPPGGRAAGPPEARFCSGVMFQPPAARPRHPPRERETLTRAGRVTARSAAPRPSSKLPRFGTLSPVLDAPTSHAFRFELPSIHESSPKTSLCFPNDSK